MVTVMMITESIIIILHIIIITTIIIIVIIIIIIITLETLRSEEGCARRLKRLECEIYIPPPINFTTLSKIITVSIALNPYLFLYLGAHQLYNT